MRRYPFESLFIFEKFNHFWWLETWNIFGIVNMLNQIWIYWNILVINIGHIIWHSFSWYENNRSYEAMTYSRKSSITFSKIVRKLSQHHSLYLYVLIMQFYIFNYKERKERKNRDRERKRERNNTNKTKTKKGRTDFHIRYMKIYGWKDSKEFATFS